MKKTILICWLLLCVTLTSCNTHEQSNSNPSKLSNQTPQMTDVDSNDTPSEDIPAFDYTDKKANDEITPSDTANKKTYMEAYADFLLNHNIDPDDDADFPIRGYYLFDLDFDDIPELGVFRDSLGSMGGYFTYYRFDGYEIVSIMDNENSPVRASNYTLILADLVTQKVYMLKEMYLLQGNENGKYGYLREFVIQDGIPYVYSVLDLTVDEESDLEKHIGKAYYYEDEFLSDTGLDECLLTRYCSDDEWMDISSAEYLKIKRERIPTGNTFIDLRDTDVCFIGAKEDMIDESDGEFRNIQITSDEIDTLFAKWLEHIA